MSERPTIVTVDCSNPGSQPRARPMSDDELAQWQADRAAGEPPEPPPVVGLAQIAGAIAAAADFAEAKANLLEILPPPQTTGGGDSDASPPPP